MRSLALIYCVAATLSAQSSPDTVQKTFFVRRDLLMTGGIIAGSAAISAFDLRIARWMRSPEVQGSQKRHDAMEALTVINEVPLTVAGIVTYGVGRLSHDEDIADAGLHTTEALVATVGIAEAIRGPLGRLRPRESPDDQYDFKFWRGFTDFAGRSYPSIHASVAFATAASLVEEVRIHRPQGAGIMEPAIYAIAAIPGFTRMYLDQHWASDVAAGTVFGVFMGQRVVRYAHSHERTKMDRWLLGRVKVVPTADGGALLLYDVDGH